MSSGGTGPANALRGGLLGGEWTTDDQVDLQAGGGLDDLAHPAQIIHARQLHQDLVGAQVVFLDGGLGDSQSY